MFFLFWNNLENKLFWVDDTAGHWKAVCFFCCIIDDESILGRKIWKAGGDGHVLDKQLYYRDLCFNNDFIVSSICIFFIGDVGISASIRVVTVGLRRKISFVKAPKVSPIKTIVSYGVNIASWTRRVAYDIVCDNNPYVYSEKLWNSGNCILLSNGVFCTSLLVSLYGIL